MSLKTPPHTAEFFTADDTPVPPKTLTTLMNKLIKILCTRSWEEKNEKSISTYAPPKLVTPNDGCVSSSSASLQMSMAWRRVLRASADVLGSSIGGSRIHVLCQKPFLEHETRVLLARWRGAMMPRALCTDLSDSFGVGREYHLNMYFGRKQLAGGVLIYYSLSLF